jgi:hypothetical protein
MGRGFEVKFSSCRRAMSQMYVGLIFALGACISHKLRIGEANMPEDLPSQKSAHAPWFQVMCFVTFLKRRRD